MSVLSDRTALAGWRRQSSQAGSFVSTFSLLAAGVLVVLLLAGANSALRDPDNWWQVKVGLDILSSGRLPSVDTYSYTFAGQPWIAKEWLGQIILALGYLLGNWSGVAFVTIAMVVLTIGLVTQYLMRFLRPTAAIAVAVVLVALMAPFYNARPFILTYPLLVIWTSQLFEAARHEMPPPWWLLTVLCLWANLHATFTFGFVIALFAWLDLIERTWLNKPRLLGRWIAFGLLCPLVSMIQPYGLRAILATFTVVHGNEAVPHIAEWHPFDASTQYVDSAALLACIFVLMTSRFRLGFAKAAFLLLALFLFLIHVRLGYLLFLTAPILVVPEIAGRYPRVTMRHWLASPRDRFELLLSRFSSRIRVGLLLAVAAACGLWLWLIPVHPSAKTSVEGALDYAQATGLLSRRVMNSYNFGGTLIFHGIKTYVDGRTDQLFLDGFFKNIVEMKKSGGKRLLRTELKDRNIGWALLTPDDGRVAHFEAMPDWQKTYEDKYAVIFVHKPESPEPGPAAGHAPGA